MTIIVLTMTIILDYKQSVLECDQMEYTQTRLALVDMRNNFTVRC